MRREGNLAVKFDDDYVENCVIENHSDGRTSRFIVSPVQDVHQQGNVSEEIEINNDLDIEHENEMFTGVDGMQPGANCITGDETSKLLNEELSDDIEGVCNDCSTYKHVK